MANDLIKAKLVYDGGDEVFIPPEMGTPRADQMQGTPAERLCEAACRVCYDSMGTGRPSLSIDGKEGMHEHISKVKHYSTVEHPFHTFEIWEIPNDGVRTSILAEQSSPEGLSWPGANAALRECDARIQGVLTDEHGVETSTGARA